MPIFHGNAIPSASGDFDIPYSCRFEKPGGTKLQSTVDHSANYTVSCWVKRCNMSFTVGAFIQYIWRFGGEDQLQFSTTDHLVVERKTGIVLTTNRKMRDPTAWYHIVVQAGTNILKIFVNGIEHDYTDGGTYTNRTGAGAGAQTSQTFAIGSSESNANQCFDGYIAEFHFCDGLALDPGSFGEFGDYDNWKPIKYAGSHGSNGFHLDFANGLAMGNDVSGNNNDLTPTNIYNIDQVLDTPTNNFCVLNVVNQSPTAGVEMSEGSLRMKGNAGGTYQLGRNGTLHTKNKTYYEIMVEATPGNNSTIMEFGFAPEDYNPSRTIGNDYLSSRPGYTAVTGSNTNFTNHGVCVDRSYSLCYYDGTSNTAVPVTTFAIGDIIQCAFDPVSGKFWYGLNNTWFGTGHASNGDPATGANPLVTLTNLDHTWTPNVGCYLATGIMRLNFGQDSSFAGQTAAGTYTDENDIGNFKYPVPAGFLALCSKNQPDCAIIPSEHFNAVPYTGNAGTQDIAVGFPTDLTWIKCRTIAHNHEILDKLRGPLQRMRSDQNSIETTTAGGLTAFTSTGFTLGSTAEYNQTSAPFISWNWKADGAGSSNTDGTINTTSTSANVAAGFSISTFSGNSVAGATVGHGLSKKPDLVIVKRRDVGIASWSVGFETYTGGAGPSGAPCMNFTDYMIIDTNGAVGDSIDQWNDQAPTASVVYLGTQGSVNATGSTYVMYCWHSVEGYSQIGWYWGNANADGTYQYTGFRPEYLMMKKINGTGGWIIHDAERNAAGVDASGRNKWGNTSSKILDAEDHIAEAAGVNHHVDLLSNGFKLRSDWTAQNANNDYLYMAFAKTPFKQGTAN